MLVKYPNERGWFVVPKFVEYILLVVFLAVLGLGIYNFVVSNRVEVPEEAVREPVTVAATVPQTTAPTTPPRGTTPPVTENTEPETEPEPKPRELLPRIAELREYYNNPDIVGYIQIPGTNISYPVAQTGNNAFYLYHDLRWNPSRHGSVFLDYENNLYDLCCDNTIIYGHNMRDGSKFHNIRHYFREDFFRSHNYILLTTPYEETVWDVFSFFHTHIRFCYLTTNWHNAAHFYDFMLELQGMSMHSTDIVISPGDQILILSTCAITGGDYRYVLVARLRR